MSDSLLAQLEQLRAKWLTRRDTIRLAHLQRAGGMEECAADLDALCRTWQEAQGWRDIASAPKDGTLVLLGNADDPSWPLRARRWEDSHWRGHDAEDATHWMPLPAPPEPTK